MKNLERGSWQFFNRNKHILFDNYFEKRIAIQFPTVISLAVDVFWDAEKNYNYIKTAIVAFWNCWKGETKLLGNNVDRKHRVKQKMFEKIMREKQNLFEIRTNDKSADSSDRGAITNSQRKMTNKKKKMTLWIRKEACQVS